MKRRVVVADREPQGFRELLQAEIDLDVVGEAADICTAVELIEAHLPDLVVLDAELPGSSGIGVLERLGPAPRPAVILVSSCDRFALQAFEIRAVDYLLKPIAPARFQEALRRARAQIGHFEQIALGQRLDALLEEIRRPSYLDRVAIRSGQRILVVRAQDIDWIQADANYVQVHVGTKSYVLRESVTAMAAKLNPEEFVRIRRSIIVNIGRIKELQAYSSREDVVVLRDGTKLMASRNFRSQLRAVLGAA